MNFNGFATYRQKDDKHLSPAFRTTAEEDRAYDDFYTNYSQDLKNFSRIFLNTPELNLGTNSVRSTDLANIFDSLWKSRELAKYMGDDVQNRYSDMPSTMNDRLRFSYGGRAMEAKKHEDEIQNQLRIKYGLN